MNRHRLFAPIGFIIKATILLLLALFIWALATRPPWQLSARNTPSGLFVEVYKGDASEPTYQVNLPESSLPKDLPRTIRQDLPSDIGKTTFYDDTLRPGRWTVILAGQKLDIMPGNLVLNEHTSIRPKEANRSKIRP